MGKTTSQGGKSIVFYHADCLDGFCGAWAAWSILKNTAEYRPLKHEAEKLPAEIVGRDIYFIDYCFSGDIMAEIKKQARSLVVIDHHFSNIDALKAAYVSVYRIKKSGCVLAWEFFHPNKKVPELLLSVQDNDLFTLKRPLTLEYVTSLYLAEFDFKKWDRLVKQFETKQKRKELAQLGSHLLQYKNKYVAYLLKSAEPVTFHGVRAYAVNTDIFHSEAGTRIYSTLGVHLGIVWHYKEGKIKVSLRSDGVVDAAKLAARYGGGGHVGAAAFWADLPADFPWSHSASKDKRKTTLRKT
ncbi:MAG: DHHA1 domain-containing protein [Candidatus Uhrbacteria bacterium]|nr:DHHA1 domain-containing protein [Candidatus Uhrbacteria bacterium]